MLEYLKSVFDSLLMFALHLSSHGSFPKPLSVADEKKNLQLAAQGDKAARSTLIEHNLRLVSHIIKKYYSSCPDREDLLSIGTIGLIKGVDSFNINKGPRLATYASTCIRNEILMHLRTKRKDSHNVSISEPIDVDSEGNPLTLIDVMYDEDTIADDIDADVKSRQLYAYIAGLDNEREREIIIRRYGLFNTQEETQREISERFGISRSYVSRIEKRVLEKLREDFGG